MRPVLGSCVVATSVLLGLAACSPGPSNCTEGSEPTFLLTVRYGSSGEPAVRFCDTDQCSPAPVSGPIPDLLLDRDQDAPARLDHLGPGYWRIAPRGAASGDVPPPSTPRIELYRDGSRVSTTTVRLDWPSVDPCAATPEPLPSTTITLR